MRTRRVLLVVLPVLAVLAAAPRPCLTAGPLQIGVRLTDEHGVPIEGQPVRAEHLVTGDTARGTTGARGQLELSEGSDGAPLAPGPYVVHVERWGQIERRFVFLEEGRSSVTFRWLRDPEPWTAAGVVGLGAREKARQAALTGNDAAYAEAVSVIELERDEAERTATSAASTLDRLENDVFADPAIPDAAGLRSELEAAETPRQKAEIAEKHWLRLGKLVSRAGDLAAPEAKRSLRKLAALRRLYLGLHQANHHFELRSAQLLELEERRLRRAGGDFRTGSVVPAGPGEFFASFSPRADVVDLPDFEYVTVADFNQQVVFVPELLNFDNDGAGYDLGWEGGYVFREPCLGIGSKSWLEGGFHYGRFEARNTKDVVSVGNADVEFFSPRGGGGFTLLNPGQLTDVRYDLDHERFAGSLALYEELGPCDCGLRVTPFAGVAWESLEFDQTLRLDAGNFSVERSDGIDRHAGGVRAGVYLSRPLGPLTVYAGGYGGILYAGADGDARLVGRLNGNVFSDDRKKIEEHGVVFEGGGALGLRFDLDIGLPLGVRPSVGVEAAFDWTDGALEIDYPNSLRGNADLDFRSAWSSRVGAQLTLSF